MKPFAAIAAVALSAMLPGPALASPSGATTQGGGTASVVTMDGYDLSGSPSFTTAVDAIAGYHQAAEANGVEPTAQAAGQGADFATLLSDDDSLLTQTEAQTAIGPLSVARSQDPFDFRLPGGIGETVRRATAGLAGLAGLATTPEPATWAMMFAGFIGIGFALRRRWRHVAA